MSCCLGLLSYRLSEKSLFCQNKLSEWNRFLPNRGEGVGGLQSCKSLAMISKIFGTKPANPLRYFMGGGTKDVLNGIHTTTLKG